MRKKQPPEIVPGDKGLRQNLLLLLAAYILLLIWLEPLIDFLLSFDPLSDDPLAMNALNQRKIMMSKVAFAIMRSVPIALFFWVGYRSVLSASLPPARMRFPFTVVRIKGKQAKMFGVLIMIVCLILFSHEMVLLAGSLS